MRIRFDAIKDFEEAIAIAKDLPDFFTESAFLEIKRSLLKELSFGAYLDNNLVGFLTVKKVNSKVVELTWMGIAREYQNKGIGTKLLKNALDNLDKQYKIAYIKTLADSVEDTGYSNTRRFWLSNGFFPLEVIDPYPGWEPGNPCLIFVKPL